MPEARLTALPDAGLTEMRVPNSSQFAIGHVLDPAFRPDA
jgi:hypothetical protein